MMPSWIRIRSIVVLVMIYTLAIRLWIAWLTAVRIWLQAARAPFKAAEAKEVERFEAEMLAYNEPVRTTHAFCALLFAPRMTSSMTDDQGTFADLAYPCTHALMSTIYLYESCGLSDAAESMCTLVLTVM